MFYNSYIINEEQYNRQKKEINNKIDDLLENLKIKRINLENDFDDQHYQIQQQIDEKANNLDIYQSRTQEAADGLDRIYQQMLGNQFFDKTTYLSELGRIDNLNREQIGQYQEAIENLDQAQTDALQGYHQQDDQLQSDTFDDVHLLEAKLKDLKDDFNSDDNA